MTVTELFQNREYYINQPLLQASREDIAFSEVTVFTEELRRVKRSVNGNQRGGSHSVQVVWNVPHYGTLNCYWKSYFLGLSNCTIYCQSGTFSTDWWSHGHCSKKKKALEVRHNHFVPLFHENANADPNGSFQSYEPSVNPISDKSGQTTNFFSRVDTKQEKSKKRILDLSKEKPCFQSKRKRSSGSPVQNCNDSNNVKNRASREQRVPQMEGKVEDNQKQSEWSKTVRAE